jgi:hypothetical protein
VRDPFILTIAEPHHVDDFLNEGVAVETASLGVICIIHLRIKTLARTTRHRTFHTHLVGIAIAVLEFFSNLSVFGNSFLVGATVKVVVRLDKGPGLSLELPTKVRSTVGNLYQQFRPVLINQ